MDLKRILLDRFGYENFRPGQEEVIRHVLDKRDTIAILPTGMGKSLCYQLPGSMMEGSVIIISPLVSLMEDQAMRMRQSGEKRVIALNSFLPYSERQRILGQLQNYKFIFISPEMLSQEAFGRQLNRMRISLVVIDEAHCISQWGFDFRPDYLRIGDFLKLKGRPPLLALTATADEKVLNDIQQYLQMEKPIVQRHSLDRPNISYSIVEVNSPLEKTAWIKNRIAQTVGPGIIYAASRKRADELAIELQLEGVAVQSYHAGKEQDDRSIIQEQFLNGDLEWICATNAFGMGVHKDDIRQVIHDHLPPAVAAYIQEVGRAGRDGHPAAASLLYMPTDEQTTSYIIQSDLPREEEIRYYHRMLTEGHSPGSASELASLTETGKRVLDYYMEHYPLEEILLRLHGLSNEKNEQLRQMVQLVIGGACIRQRALSYFGEAGRNKPVECCSICGLDHVNWLYDKSITKSAEEKVSWDERITNLLG
ncbi:RecQ family ATP-dependent DNA helicase [Sporosarcina luteola]|uniref:RecQ family ATP-dependent DNA helicase n=1 Tax=Sporosarcina luteola TaxID=582850 RepID=UPI00203B6253|nr:ATP-dependent DNA helicase RecQ [Sporosarcina luteola]MCM3709798.1 ATP-dependent DNA helicase [Sporosarcina luteola]